MRAIAAAVLALAMAVALRGRMPDPAEVAAALGGADLRWLALAVVLQPLSQTAFAWQQRTMLAALGVGTSARDAVAVTYTRAAISLTFPAGSAVATAYAIRQFRRRGASTATAATGVLLSGVASVTGLVLCYALVAGSAAITWLPPIGIAAAVLAVGATIALARSARGREILRKVRPRHWLAAVGLSVLTWLLDLGCLTAAAYACGLPVTAAELATVYLGVQVVRQIPITPGGVGLIEASLLTGLVTAGAAHAPAAAAVLVYRLMTCWLVLPVGLASHLVAGRGRGRDRVTQVSSDAAQ